MKTSQYWPLNMYPECEIYDNVAWDLPGFRRQRLSAGKSARNLVAELPERRQPE
jgi:hypothetical protein